MLLAHRTRSRDNDREIVVQRTFANDPYLENVQMLRDAGVGLHGESRLAGRIPMHHVGQWLKEAGVSWDDSAAVSEVIKRNMLSGEFDKFRVWQGRF